MDEIHKAIELRAYYIGQNKDRQGIKHTQLDDWVEAEAIENLNSGTFDNMKPIKYYDQHNWGQADI